MYVFQCFIISIKTPRVLYKISEGDCVQQQINSAVGRVRALTKMQFKIFTKRRENIFNNKLHDANKITKIHSYENNKLL